MTNIKILEAAEYTLTHFLYGLTYDEYIETVDRIYKICDGGKNDGEENMYDICKNLFDLIDHIETEGLFNN